MTTHNPLGPERLGQRTEGKITVDLEPPARALAVTAHPDDADFFVAGTFAKWAAAGTACAYLVLTDGSKGSWQDRDPAELAATRAAEQRAAAAAVGVSEVASCSREDGFLQADLSTRRQVAEWIRHLAPDVVVTHDPWKPYRLHPDHRAAGFVTLDAVAVAREALAYPDSQSGPHRPEHVWLFETDVPDHFESITESLDTKLTALLSHVSQYQSTMGIDDPDDVPGIRAFRTRVRDWAYRLGVPAGLTHAEAFKVVLT